MTKKLKHAVKRLAKKMTAGKRRQNIEARKLERKLERTMKLLAVLRWCEVIARMAKESGAPRSRITRRGIKKVAELHRVGEERVEKLMDEAFQRAA